MNDLAVLLLGALLRTGLVLCVSALVLTSCLRVFHVNSPRVRRAAYFAVVLQGCLLVQGPLKLPLPSFVPMAIKTVRWNKLAKRAPAHRDDRLDALSRPAQAVQTTALHQVEIGDDVSGSHQTETLLPSDADFVQPTQRQSPAAPFPWAMMLAGAWAAGVIVLAGRSAWMYARFVRHFPAAENVEHEWATEWATLQRQAGVGALVPLAVAEQSGPVLCRLPHGYRLIVPAGAWRNLDSAQRQLVLRHELAHIERRDVWKSLAMRVLALPHWFNPLVWRIVRQFDECAEWACDDAAQTSDQGAPPEQRTGYARALLQLAHPAEPIFFATGAARGSGLSYRIRRLLTPANEKGSKMKNAAVATLLLGISLFNVTRLQSQSDAAPPANKDKGDGPKASAPPAAKPHRERTELQEHAVPLQARVNLGQILMNLREFQRSAQKLKAELQASEESLAKEEEMIRSVQKQALQEQDQAVKTVLREGITQKRMQMARRQAADRAKLIAMEKEMYHNILQKVIVEAVRYAQERRIFVLRRADLGTFSDVLPFEAFRRSWAAPRTPSGGMTVHAIPLQIFAAETILGIPAPANADSRRGPAIDISDEIVKRLNAADDAKEGSKKAN